MAPLANQMTIPVPEGPVALGRCAWCEDKAQELLQLEKPRYTVAANGQRVLARRALTVPVCARHARSLSSGT